MITALALALTLTAAGPAQGPWVLTCNMTAPQEDQSGPNAHRMFRIGPQLFQAWNPTTNQFGPNLCSSYTCRGDQARLEGEISSTTLVLTIGLDLATHQATWRATGASNLRATNGPCTVKADQPPRPATPPGPLRSPIPGQPPR
jgi:hypothetical protein